MKRFLSISLGLLATCGVHAQTIDSTSHATLPRSDRLVIYGSSFGADQGAGRVEIAGIAAPISLWTNERIHAYVPEGAPLGATDVQVFAPDGSNTITLEVAPREPGDGRVRWRFRTDDSMLRAQPAVGPDGTVYCTGLYGHMYAIAPDGGLKWIVRAFGNTAPDVGPDGTIYVGGGATIKAWNPDGTERWRFDGSGTMFAGPNVGPDGNIYGATGGYTGNETGAFVLSPDGELLFSYPGLNFRTSPAAWEVAFGDGQWFVTSGMGWPGEGIIGLLSFDLGGGFNWLGEGLGQACANAAGNVYVNNPQGNSISSYDGDGNARWHVSLNDLPGRSPSPPTLGPDGTFYVPQTAPWWLNAIDASGTVLWSQQYYDHVTYPVVRDDNAMIVAGGYAPSYPELNTVQAIAPATGELLWSADLPFADSSWKVNQQWYAEFSNDGRTVYVPTSGTEAGEPFSFLYAIDATLTGVGDVNGDGNVNFQDVLVILGGWGPCEGECPEDLDGDGHVGFGDLLVVLANWS